MTGLWLIVAATIIGCLAWHAGRAYERTHAPDTEHLLDDLDHATQVIARQQASIRDLRQKIHYLAPQARP